MIECESFGQFSERCAGLCSDEVMIVERQGDALSISEILIFVRLQTQRDHSFYSVCLMGRIVVSMICLRILEDNRASGGCDLLHDCSTCINSPFEMWA